MGERQAKVNEKRQYFKGWETLVFNFAMNVLSAIAAYCFFEKKPAVNIDFAIEQHSGQLTLF